MDRKRSIVWKAGISAVLAGVAFALVQAQGDSPTHRGQNSRSGVNVSPTEPGPGLANLRWWHPLQSTQGRSISLDNTSAGYSEPTGAWATPAPLEESPDWTGSAGNPYRYTSVVASTAGTGDPTAGATATARWSFTGLDPDKYYSLSVWFPSSGTRPGGVLAPNSDYAVYRIDYENGNQFVDIVPHDGGGTWIRLGNNLTTTNRIFKPDALGNITVTLFNSVPRDAGDNLMGPVTNRIVVADSAIAVPAPGEIWSSPVVKDIGAVDLVVAVRNEARPDPTDPTNSVEIQTGVVYGIDASGVNISLPRWVWSPSLVTNFNQVFDNTNPAFTHDAGWTDPAVPAGPNSYGPNYVDAPATITAPATASARWDPALPSDGYYDVYVWFPNEPNPPLHARAAEYIVHESGTNVTFYVDQTQGGRWVRIGTRPFLHNTLAGGLELEVTNFSNFGGDAGRRVVADAVMFVGRYQAAIYSTPTIATVNLRTSGGPVVPTECVFVAADDGHIYCLDANGNGNGGTTVYWAYPSIPDINDPSWTDPNDSIDGPTGSRASMPGAFGVSSMVVANVGGKDVLFVASQNGRVYAIDCEGRGDYDVSTGKPGTTTRDWTWPRSIYNGTSVVQDPARLPFVGSVAYDAATEQVFAAGTEGRLFAIDAQGNANRTTDLNWAWPDFVDEPVGAFTCTPTIGGTHVIVPSFDGFVYARDIGGSTAAVDNWQYPPAASTPLEPFQFSSACYVPQGRFLPPAPADDLVYFVNDNGTAYCVQGSDGTLVWQTDELGIGAWSSPYFTPIQPPGVVGTFDVITFGTLGGAFIALYANPANTNSAGTRLAWGYQSEGSRVFASPAISRGWMYHAGIDGFTYAFSTGGVISVDPGFTPPGDEIATPDDPIPGFDDMKLKFVFKNGYEQLRAPAPPDPAGLPEKDPPPTIPALEWGETLYITAYDFVYPVPPDSVTVRFRVTGPGGLNLTYDRPAELISGRAPGSPSSGFAVIGVPMIASGPNFLTPGSGIRVDAIVLYNGRQFDPPNLLARNITVANPIAVTTVSNYVGTPPANKSIGWTPIATDPENRINGSNNKRLMTSVGQVVHGQSGANRFNVADRSVLLELTGTGLKRVRMTRTDGMWRGGPAAVIKPLPYVPAWEVLPTTRPNLSPDYPDIDRTDIDLVADPFGQSTDPLIQDVSLDPPSGYDPNNPTTRILEGVPFGVEFNILRFQPANLTGYVDAAGDTLDGGYRSRAIVYVDSNANGRPDGLEDTLTDMPPNFRREAFRSLNFGVSVPVDENLAIVEQTVDLGSEPHSLGYTPVAPWVVGNLFVPDISVGAPFRLFFQPFTTRNEGNVNMLDLRIATRIRRPDGTYYPVAFESAAVDPLAWLDGWPNIITNLNPPYAPDQGVYDASGNPRVTLHKARPGDRSPTVLSVPDVPYGFTPPPNSQPLVGVAVPLGHPVGEYRQLINVIEDSFLIGGQNDVALALGTGNQPIEAFSDPTMTVRFINRETRLTGGVTSGSAIHVDEPLPGPTNFTWTNVAPGVYRDATGNLNMAWVSNRPGLPNSIAAPQPQDAWRLYFGFVRATPQGSLPAQVGTSPLRDLMGWLPMGNAFWWKYRGPEPSEPLTTLFAGTPGVIVGTAQFADPTFCYNPRQVPIPSPEGDLMFFTGRVLKDDSADGRPDFSDNRIFYRSYTMGPGYVQPALGPLNWIAWDPAVEKRRPRVINFSGNGQVVFWYSNVNGKNRLFQNVRLVRSLGGGDQTDDWSKNLSVDPGTGFSSAWDPTPIDRITGIDLVFTGQLRDRAQPEIFFMKTNTDALGHVRGIQNLPERNREALAREGDTSTFRARGVNWNLRQPLEIWIRRPNQAPVRVDIPASRQTDDDTGVVSFDSETGGKIYCDPHVGTLRFAGGDPGPGAQVELRYTPRVIRVSDLGDTGGHSNPSAFLDNRYETNRLYYSRPGVFSPIVSTDAPRMARLWFVYQRGAAGAGQNFRPYMKTQRLQIRLNFPVAIDPATGNPLITVAGMAGPFYQVDPANRRVFFTLPDEGRTLTITYNYRDNFGNLQSDSVTNSVTWQAEMAESPIPIEQAVNEGSVYAFPDLFDPNPTQGPARPPQVWLFFSSTRSGSPDLYYLSVAPRFGPSRL